jgi:hypothetical protein
MINSWSGGKYNVAETVDNIVLQNTWQHFVVTYDGTDANGIKIYLNGVAQTMQVRFNQLGANSITTEDNLTFGNDFDGAELNGSLDEIMIFNRTLSAQEIKALYNATANQYYNNFTGLSEGEHSFTGYAVDASGNKNQTEERTVTIEEVDSTAPDFNITYPENTNYNSMPSTINITSSAEDISVCWYTLDAGLINSTWDCSTGTNSSANYSYGTNNLTAWINDTSNNINSSQVLFNIFDVEAPLINFTNPTPENGSAWDNGIYVNISSSDASQHYVVNNFDNSLIGWWRAEGDADDESGNGNDGSLEGGAFINSSGKNCCKSSINKP